MRQPWEFLLRLLKYQAASEALSPESTFWSLGEFLGSGQLTGDLFYCGNRIKLSEGGQTLHLKSNNTFALGGAGVRGTGFVEVFQSGQGEEF